MNKLLILGALVLTTASVGGYAAATGSLGCCPCPANACGANEADAPAQVVPVGSVDVSELATCQGCADGNSVCERRADGSTVCCFDGICMVCNDLCSACCFDGWCFCCDAPCSADCCKSGKNACCSPKKSCCGK